MNDDDLRTALHDLVPEPPATPDRAHLVHARASTNRRRRLAGTSVAALSILALGAPLGWAALSGADTDGGLGAPATAPGVVAGEFTCPDPTLVADSESEQVISDNDAIATDVVAVRLCYPGGLGWQQPADALTTDPGKVAEAINALPLQGSDAQLACEQDLGPTWGMAFQLTDGSIQIARGEGHGCGGVFIGDSVRGDRQNAFAPFDTFAALLSEQRSAREPSAPPIELACTTTINGTDNPRSLLPIAPPIELTEAVYCPPAENGSPVAIPIPAKLISQISRELSASFTTTPPTDQACAGTPTPWPSMVASTAWGDRIQISNDCNRWRIENQTPNASTLTAETALALVRLRSAQP
ncbi:hypothetical protein ACLM5J_17280 [Nocardioides sp. Bht2]|uniref:hypothetical protein n=1 Tax=Nocardioides sp. Bht2 TaxID=3392297 RepID=UPI0039B6BEA2